MPPAAGGGGGNANTEDSSAGLLWSLFAIFLLGGIVWHVFRPQIVSAYLSLRYHEISALSVVMHNSDIVSLKNSLATLDPEALNFSDLILVGKITGNYLRIPLVIILLVLAFIVYCGNTVRKFKTVYSMKSLAYSEQGNWPQIMPVIGKNILQQDLDNGIWAMAMTPIQFSKKYNLMEIYRRQSSDLLNKNSRIEIVLKRGEANKIFTLQLGERWRGFAKTPLYVQALFAIFAARINADTAEAAKLIKQLNISSTSKLDYSGVKALYAKHANSKLVKKILTNHAYVATVMASMLVACRQDGVQATADFIWLKTLDRSLWYMLNNMGRQTAFIECAGPYAHWLAEKEAGRKLIIPMINTATDALELSLKSMIYNPEEDN
jgi:intracellular multiplication protein IcmP